MRTISLSGLLMAATMALSTGCAPSAPGGGSDDGGGGGGDGGVLPDARLPGDGGDCPSIVATATPVVPTVMLVVDRSGSMDKAFGNTSRLAAVKNALTGPDGVVTRLAGRVRFGAGVYPPIGAACATGMTSISPALGNGGAVTNLFASVIADGITPTQQALAAVPAMIGSDEPRIVILATDGDPTGCSLFEPGTPEDAVLAQVATLRGMGIALYVLAVGPEVGAEHLQDVANVGAGLPVDGSGGNAPSYTALDPAALEAALDTIIAGERACTFTLDGHVAPSRAAEGLVTLDGQPLTYGAPDGWTMSDDQTLVLNGAACEAYLSGAASTVDAEFPCGVLIP